jgi:hypothetical protein
MDWYRQRFVCDLGHQLDNSGTQFWLLDTDERAYKKDPLCRRRGTINWRVNKVCIAAVATLTSQNTI